MAAAAVAGALAYAALEADREYDRLIAVADRAMADDQPFQAIEAYSGAIALKPDSMLAHLKRGQVYQTQGQLDAALRDFKLSTESDPTAPMPLELLGDVSAQLGRSDRAIERYESYLALDERSPRVLYKLGLARYRAGLTASAATALQQAVALDPSLVEAYYVLGLVRRDLGAPAEARKALERALRLSPGRPSIREALADVYAVQEDPANQLDQLEALAALEPDVADRLVALGLAQDREGRQDLAVLTLRRAIDRFPETPQVYAALGHIWLRAAETRGDRIALKKAVEALAQAAGRADASSETLAELARAWTLSGDAAAAERALRQAVSRLPVPPDAYLQLAAITERDGRIQEARDAMITYAMLVGDTQPLVSVATRIADLSLRLGEPALAVRWLERALDETGPTSQLFARLADAAWKSGDLPRARRAVDEGLQAEPTDRTLRQLKQRLPPL